MGKFLNFQLNIKNLKYPSIAKMLSGFTERSLRGHCKLKSSHKRQYPL
ncbi:hypothetical protein ADICYQ_0404 [Cyclobacterium qasimii M12-11B]|uniref:Uncharacterized protein n=1 Tax=Cyclobacterium qasimii M12-11B TaxID=641524 RepID=S7VMZ9_9BACT|nr:hypothetical protein ADICYQ_0404 [Cyclobacterium qasimii M12-11B]